MQVITSARAPLVGPLINIRILAAAPTKLEWLPEYLTVKNVREGLGSYPSNADARRTVRVTEGCYLRGMCIHIHTYVLFTNFRSRCFLVGGHSTLIEDGGRRCFGGLRN